MCVVLTFYHHIIVSFCLWVIDNSIFYAHHLPPCLPLSSPIQLCCACVCVCVNVCAYIHTPLNPAHCVTYTGKDHHHFTLSGTRTYTHDTCACIQ